MFLPPLPLIWFACRVEFDALMVNPLLPWQFATPSWTLRLTPAPTTVNRRFVGVIVLAHLQVLSRAHPISWRRWGSTKSLEDVGDLLVRAWSAIGGKSSAAERDHARIVQVRSRNVFIA